MEIGTGFLFVTLKLVCVLVLGKVEDERVTALFSPFSDVRRFSEAGIVTPDFQFITLFPRFVSFVLEFLSASIRVNSNCVSSRWLTHSEPDLVIVGLGIADLGIVHWCLCHR
jgi:hypothetical protein